MVFLFGVDVAIRAGLSLGRNVTSAVIHTTQNVLPGGRYHQDDNQLLNEYVAAGEGQETTGAATQEEFHVYDEASGTLDVSTLAYTFIEFRRNARITLTAYRNRDGGLSKSETKVTFTEKNFSVIKNAVELRDNCSEELVKIGRGESKAAYADAVKKYSDAVQGLEGLMKKWDLTKNDVDKISYEQKMLVLPKPAGEIRRAFRDKADSMRLFLAMFGGASLSNDALDSIFENAGSDSYLYAVDDDFTEGFAGVNSELVWAITVNETKKRIAVVFRGTVPTVVKDYLVDANIVLKDCEIPSPYDRNDGRRGIKENMYGRVHKGFYDYLFGADGRRISKSAAIMGKVIELYNSDPKYKEFKLYVTGHSLGGALSTLFAFKAAMDPAIPNKPVTNVSFASPFVGEQKFREAFQKLEVDGKIRHLRISADEDIVPLVPPAQLLFVGTRYKHTGMNIRLYEKSWWHPSSYDVFYPKKNGNALDELHLAINSNPIGGLPLSNGLLHHMPIMYRKRLDEAKKDLMEVKLNKDFYSRKSLTGF